MANNYTETTVEPSRLTITPPLVAVLKAHGAEIQGGGPNTALDQVARGNRNLKNAYVFFESGFSDYEDGYSDEPDLDGLDDEEKAEVERLLKLDEVDLFRELLKVNPEVNCIEVKSAWRCDKMRPGEFGGNGLYVTRTHFCYVGSDSIQVTKDGTLEVTATVEKFHDAPPV